jgi:hypothetical protein
LPAQLAPPDGASSPCCRQRRTLTTSNRSAKRRRPTHLILYRRSSQVVRCEGLANPASTVCAARCTATLYPVSDQNKYRLVTGHGLKDSISWAPPALAICCCSVGLLRGAGGGGRRGGEGGAPGQARKPGGRAWASFVGTLLGMPLPHPPSSWPTVVITRICTRSHTRTRDAPIHGLTDMPLARSGWHSWGGAKNRK